MAERVQCFMCRPEESKMPIEFLEGTHLPLMHYRMAKDKTDERLNRYKEHFISTIVELSKCASQLPNDAAVQAMFENVVRLPEVKLHNLRVQFCKKCAENPNGSSFAASSESIMRAHVMKDHVEDAKRKDDNEVSRVFAECFPDSITPI